MRTTHTDLATLAQLIDRSAFADDDRQLADAIRHHADRALATGLHPAIAEIVTDPKAPPVARQRAFGLLSRHLATSGRGLRTVDRPLAA